MNTRKNLLHSERGDAVVEATFLLPIILMVVFALILLSIYLPTRANLQRGTELAATTIATTKSDTWIYYDTDKKGLNRYHSKSQLDNVYYALFKGANGTKGDEGAIAREIVERMGSKLLGIRPNDLAVNCEVVNYVVYKEVVVTATRSIRTPINLSMVGLPKEMEITVTSRAMVTDGDEFVRDMDIAKDLCTVIGEKLHLNKFFSDVDTFMKKVYSTMGIGE